MPAKTENNTEPPDNRPVEPPHYRGHRERLRERFRIAGPDALSDYELLEMALRCRGATPSPWPKRC